MSSNGQSLSVDVMMTLIGIPSYHCFVKIAKHLFIVENQWDVKDKNQRHVKTDEQASFLIRESKDKMLPGARIVPANSLRSNVGK